MMRFLLLYLAFVALLLSLKPADAQPEAQPQTEIRWRPASPDSVPLLEIGSIALGPFSRESVFATGLNIYIYPGFIEEVRERFGQLPKGAETDEVVITYDGCTVKMTFDEFLRKVGVVK